MTPPNLAPTAARARTLLVMAGGTGGHIFPALAVAEEMRARGWRVVWLGNEQNMEGRLVPQHGFEAQWLNFTALRGKGIVRKLMLPWNLLRACFAAQQVLRRVRPDVVLGMGGYISFPGGLMAALTGIPLVLHEQNAIAGLANRVLARVAKKTLTGFPDTLPGGQWVGNPVRAEICALPAPQTRFASRQGALRLLVVGGSLGAQALNETVPRALALLAPEERPQVVHQAGAKHLDTLQAAYAEAKVEADVTAFIDNMAERYAEADLVICRAGAMTVAEIAAAGLGAIFVPFPFAVDDHQSANAGFLARAGAAVLMQQTALTAESLAAQLRDLQREKLADMAARARALAQTSAAADVADVCAALAGEQA